MSKQFSCTQASACVMLTSVSLPKEKHMAKPRFTGFHHLMGERLYIQRWKEFVAIFVICTEWILLTTYSASGFILDN